MLCSRCNTDAKRSLSLFFMSSYYGSICYPCTSDLILQFHTTNHTTYTALLVYYAGCSAVLCFYYYRLVSDPYRGNDSWGISFLPSSLSSSSLLYMSSSLASHFVPFGQRPKQRRRGYCCLDDTIYHFLTNNTNFEHLLYNSQGTLTSIKVMTSDAKPRAMS